MTARDDLDRHLAAWLAADAPAREPEHLLGQVLARTARTRRRPAWRVPERWIPMDVTTTKLVPGPQVSWRLVGALALLLVAVLLGALLVAGSRPHRLPAPFGPAANGLVAYASGGDLLVADPMGGTSTLIAGGQARISNPVWSPDGTRLAFLRDATGGGKRVYVADADGTHELQLTADTFGGIEGLEFSPDGSTLLFTYPKGTGRLIAIADTDGSGLQTLDPHLLYVSVAQFRPPDGDEILVVGRSAQWEGIYVVDPTGSEPLRTVVSPDGRHYLGEAAWSPDGSRIAYDAWRDDRRSPSGRTSSRPMALATGCSIQRSVAPGTAAWRGRTTAPAWRSCGATTRSATVTRGPPSSPWMAATRASRRRLARP